MKYVFENGGITWWKGYCPLCATRNILGTMKKNVKGNFICISCEIQIYADEADKKAVILKARGERRFPSLDFSLESDFYLKQNALTLVLCPQTSVEAPYHDGLTRFTVVRELEKHVWETRKNFI